MLNLHDRVNNLCSLVSTKDRNGLPSERERFALRFHLARLSVATAREDEWTDFPPSEE